MPPWLPPLCLIPGKNIQFGIMVFLEVQKINLQGNIRGSKCDEYCIFLWKLFRFTKKLLSLFFPEKVPFPVAFFTKYFYLNSL